MSAITPNSNSPDGFVPLNSIAGTWLGTGHDPRLVPTYSKLKQDAYSGRFAVEKVNGKLVVRQDTLREMAQFYGLGGSDRAAAAA